jgi:hypothetical protein
MEIFRKEWETSKGEEVRTTQAEFLKDGTLRVSGADFGPLVETWWGDDDYEYWMEIAPEDSKELLLLILREAFNAGLKLTFTSLKELCEANGINPKFDSWV